MQSTLLDLEAQRSSGNRRRVLPAPSIPYRDGDGFFCSLALSLVQPFRAVHDEGLKVAC